MQLQKRILNAYRNQRYGAVSKLCRSLLRNQPSDPFAHFHLALAYYYTGKYSRALDHALLVRRKHSNHPNIHLNIGCILDALGREDLAIRSYKRELSRYPECAAALYNLGMLYYERRRCSDALPFLRKCYELRHSMGSVVLKLAFCYNRLGSIQEEIRLYRDHLKRHPRHVLCLMNLGSALLDQSQYKQSLKCLERAKELAPKNSVINRWLKKAREGRASASSTTRL